MILSRKVSNSSPETHTREWRWSKKPTNETNSDSSTLKSCKHICYKINYNESYIAKYLLEKRDIAYMLEDTTALCRVWNTGLKQVSCLKPETQVSTLLTLSCLDHFRILANSISALAVSRPRDGRGSNGLLFWAVAFQLSNFKWHERRVV